MSDFIIAYAEAASALSDRIEEMAKPLKSSYADRIDVAVGSVAPMIRGIAGIAHNPSPEMTVEGNFLKLTEKVDEAEQHTTKLINSISAIQSEWEADLTRRENAACGFDRTSEDKDGILNRFCAKSQADQLQDMARWLKDGKKGGMYLGLVERADEYRTGVAPDMIQRFKRDFIAINAPNLAAEREAIGKIAEAGLTAAKLTTRVKQSTSDVRRYVEIRDRKARHSAAEAEFLAAFHPRAA